MDDSSLILVESYELKHAHGWPIYFYESYGAYNLEVVITLWWNMVCFLCGWSHCSIFFDELVSSIETVDC